jgi:hypothetical protein
VDLLQKKGGADPNSMVFLEYLKRYSTKSSFLELGEITDHCHWLHKKRFVLLFSPFPTTLPSAPRATPPPALPFPAPLLPSERRGRATGRRRGRARSQLPYASLPSVTSSGEAARPRLVPAPAIARAGPGGEAACACPGDGGVPARSGGKVARAFLGGEAHAPTPTAAPCLPAPTAARACPSDGVVPSCKCNQALSGFW